jgi:hypothetical protein
MKRTTLQASLFLAAAVTVSIASYADDKAMCLDAASKGQTLRDEHKLVEARDRFRACARQECPSLVQQDCGRWLGEVERDLPTVVITAKDGGGTDRVDVKVSLDGQPFADKLDGQAVAIDPGRHLMHFETADGARVDRLVLVKEGERNQTVEVVLGVAVDPTKKAATESGSLSGVAVAAHGGGTGPWRTVGWVLGGVGVAGLGVGAVFGVLAIGDKSSAHCNAGICANTDALNSAKSAATGANVGLIAGGVLLATGVGLVLFAPRSREASTPVAVIAPAVGPGLGGVALEGRW